VGKGNKNRGGGKGRYKKSGKKEKTTDNVNERLCEDRWRKLGKREKNKGQGGVELGYPSPTLPSTSVSISRWGGKKKKGKHGEQRRGAKIKPGSMKNKEWRFPGGLCRKKDLIGEKTPPC